MIDEIYIVLDESGAMHDKNNYFIIRGYLTKNLLQVKAKCKKIEQKIRNSHLTYYDPIKEIKGINIKPKDISRYLSYIFQKTISLTPISIVINKKELKKQKWHENSAFNYFSKCLIKYLVQQNLLDQSISKVNLFIDNRTVNVIFKNDLETHLNLEFFQENLIFKIAYKDSFENLEIRLADLISYSIFQHYNKNTKRALNINLKLKNFKDQLNQIQCHFPWVNEKSYWHK